MKKWIIVFTALILIASTYWSLSFASDTDLDSNNGDGIISQGDADENSESEAASTEEDVQPSDESNVDGNGKDYDSVDGEKSVEMDVDDFITALFIHGDIQIGDTKDMLLEKHGPPEAEGMYEGGEFLDYGKLTYFVNPDTNKINAIAVPGEELDIDKWNVVEEALVTSLKMEGMNEMEGLWMEIYDWGTYDIMVEREAEDAAPYYIWLMDDGLFTE